MSACQEVQEWERSLSLLNTLESRRLSPDLFTYATAIGSLSSRWPLAVELLEQLLDSGLRPNLVVCNALLATCAAEQADLALKIWRELRDWEPRGPSDAQNQVIACSSVLCAEVGWEMAFTLLEDARSLGLQLDVVCYGSAISSCERQEAWEHALQLLGLVEEESLQTTSVLLNCAISLCKRTWSADWQQALSLLRNAQQEALEPDLISYNTVISVCEKGTRWQQAVALLREAVVVRLQIDVITYSAVMTACNQVNAWHLALSLFGEMMDVRIRLSSVACNACMASLGHGFLWQGVLDTFQGLKQRSLQADILSYHVAISSAGRGRKWRQSVRRLEEVQAEVRADVMTHHMGA